MADIESLRRLPETDPGERQKAAYEALRASRQDEREVRAASAEAIAATLEPAGALDALQRLATDDDVGVRLQATVALSTLPWRGRLDRLAMQLDDEDLGVVAAAADGLAFARDRRAIPALRSILGERRLRFQALENLVDLDDEELTAVASKLFGAFLTPPFERAAAAVQLARHGDRNALKHLLTRASKKRAEERPYIVVHLASLAPEGRALVEAVAAAEDDYLRESALLALARIDSSWWARAQEAIARYSDSDPHVSAEMLLGLFEVDWARAGLIAPAHVGRDDELGAAARRVRLATALRDEFASEVLLRCV